MADVKLTDAQQEAVLAKDKAVLVSAGAGSGKTKVLTERLMRYITEDHLSIDQFVIITFTQNSAGELRTRISNALRKLGLNKQVVLLEKAQIGTIHHFCASILRQNAHAVHISPDFRIISEERAEQMRNVALEAVLEDRYSHMDRFPGFEELVNTAGIGRNDEKLVELVKQLHDKMQCHAQPAQWARERISQLSVSQEKAEDTIWGEEILSSAIQTSRYWMDSMDELAEELQEDEQLNKAYAGSVLETAESIQSYIHALKQGWDAAVNAPPIAFPKLKAVRNPENPELAERTKARKKACKKAMDNLQKSISVPSEQLMPELRETAQSMEALLRLVLDFDARYAADKRRQNVLDYNDLEHFAADYLRSHDISSRYAEVMVDEYQDVSRIQDEIFTLASDHGRKLFMVGDLKQSIYRFRLAEPEIFKEKYNDREHVHTILLRENFRSRKEVIDAVNALFEKIMTEELGDTDYRENELIFGATGYEGTVPAPQVLLVPAVPGENKTVTEAEFVADKIAEMVEAKEARYGDIAILLRSFGKTGEVFRRALMERGIPVSSPQGGGFFDQAEISDLISLLRVMDNPHNDIPLLAALRSPFFGFTPDDLSGIRTENLDCDLYTALKMHAVNDDKSRRFITTLDKLREKAPDLSQDRVIRMILNETDAELICELMPDGDQRMAGLMQMVQLASKFEKDGNHGLHRFLGYLNQLKERNTDISSGQFQETAVKLMSIHKSKGLEFPVVFVCNTQHRFNLSDSYDTVLVHPELGLGPKVTDTERYAQYPSLARMAIASRLKREQLSEEMRLLYVALTRAEERLFITACVEDPQTAVEKAKETVTTDVTSSLAWILYAGTMDTVCAGRDQGQPEQPATQQIPVGEPPEELMDNFRYVYPHQEAVSVPSKINATELKQYRQQEETEIEGEELLPRLRAASVRKRNTGKDKEPSAADRGSATHLILQLMDYNKDPEEETKRLSDGKFITKRQAEIADVSAIGRFLSSPTGKLIRDAEKVHREFEFMVLCDTGELLGRAPGEEVLLRGVVDCCVEQEDGLVIVDYKTDRISSERDLKTRAEYYAPQLRAYGKAMERVFCKPVKKTLLYFLSAGQEVELPVEKNNGKAADGK